MVKAQIISLVQTQSVKVSAAERSPTLISTGPSDKQSWASFGRLSSMPRRYEAMARFLAVILLVIRIDLWMSKNQP